VPRRIVIHAGFHKTGATAIQQTLKLNRPLLKPVLRSILPPGLRDVIGTAREVSGTDDALARATFHRRFGAFLSDLQPMPRRILCLSADGLSGQMAGRPATPSYSAAVPLAQHMADCVKIAFPKTELVLFYTTCAAQDWLRNAYWEHVKSSSMTMDFDAFTTRFQGAANLDAVVDEIAAATQVRGERAQFEDNLESPFGPATPLLDLCDVPQDLRDRMTRPEPANPIADPSILERMLEVNRTITGTEQRRAAKQEIFKGADGAGT